MRGINTVSRKNVLAFGIILLSIVLLSGLSFVPAIYVEASIQIQQQQSQTQPQEQQIQQQNQIDVSQIIKQIAVKVATANPGTNAASVEKVLTELAQQYAQA